MNARSKVIVLGLDGGTWYILRRLADLGVMPNLASALERYAHGNLTSCTPPYSAPGWTTITTGLNPGKHGIFDFYRVIDGVRRPVSVHSTGARRIWQVASDAGRHVHVFNVPVTYPPSPVNGTFVSGLLTPSTESNFTYPPDLRERLLGMPGGYDPDPSSLDPMWGEALRHSSFWIRQKEAALWGILAENPWDFVFSVVQETDPLQHKFWFVMDETDPRHDPELARRYRERIWDVYKACDEAIGRRLELAEQGATFILISDHGFGRYEKLFHINRVLEQAGLLTRTRAAKRHLPVGPMQVVRAFRRLDIFGLESRLPASVRGRALDLLDSSLGVPIDWERTEAFAGPSSAECVFVSADRDRRESVCSAAIDALLAARDPATGTRILNSVHRREEIYSGPSVESLPDILLDFGDQPYLGSDRLAAPDITENITPTSGGGRHRRTGIILVAGPDVEPGLIEGAEIADVFPTVAHCLGLPVPQGLDGAVLACASHAPVEFEKRLEPPGPQEVMNDVYTEAEQAEIEASLRRLGYLE